MAPAKKRPNTRAARKPLTISSNSLQHDHLKTVMVDIFDKSQYFSTSDDALQQLKKVYKNSNFKEFEPVFKSMFKRFLHSKEQSNYFKTTCEFICKFLQHDRKPVSPSENNPTLSNPANNPRSTSRDKRPKKRKEMESDEEDELVSFLHASQTTNMNSTVVTSSEEEEDEGETVVITDHDHLIVSSFEVADLFMQAASDTCRLNAVYFVCKFLSYCKSIDQELCKAIQMRLVERIRDKRPKIRAQAVLACHGLQENKMIQEALLYHFYRDPEIVVRKALIRVMDTTIFKKLSWLCDSTQDSHKDIRTAAYQKLGKVLPEELDSKQLHKVLHNGLNERERQPNYAFKTNTLEPWLAKLYDGLDLFKLLSTFDCIGHHDDICKLLNIVFERDLDQIESSGVATKLHRVVENFRQKHFNDNCIPINMNQVDEKMVSIWFSLVKFCKANQTLVKPVKIRTVVVEPDNENDIERILDTNERPDDIVELYERLVPDLVNIFEFLKRFTEYCHETLETADETIKKKLIMKFEFIIQEIFEFILRFYEVGDDIERKTVQDVLHTMLKDNLLTDYLNNYISPIIKCLSKLIYFENPNQLINYISEMINNVRSHLEDVITAKKQAHNHPTSRLSIIPAPSNLRKRNLQEAPKTLKKVRITEVYEGEDLECEIAKRRVDLEELNDKMEACIKEKDFDGAKQVNSKINELKSQLNNLHERRYSIASDVTHMSMVIDTEPMCSNAKLSSTVIGDNSITNESDTSIDDEQDVKIFTDFPDQLLKLLELYLACLQNVQSLRSVPQTMINHLNLLSFESLDEAFQENTRIRSLMVACSGITALVDKNFAQQPSTLTLFMAACFDKRSFEVKKNGFISLVDLAIEYPDVELPNDKLETFLNFELRSYGKYNTEKSSKNELEFASALVEGTLRLFWFSLEGDRKFQPSANVLAHLIIWWFHPETESKLKQFIGVFLPMFVKEFFKKQSNTNVTWLKELLLETSVISIEFLHKYIAGSGTNNMDGTDMLSLINFLCNLLPVGFHDDMQSKLNETIENLTGSKQTDLIKYLKQAKKSLSSSVITQTGDEDEIEAVERPPSSQPLE